MTRHSGKRKAVRNFFIKPQLQFRLTMVFIGAALVASFISLGIIFLITKINLSWEMRASRKTHNTVRTAPKPLNRLCSILSSVAGYLLQSSKIDSNPLLHGHAF